MRIEDHFPESARELLVVRGRDLLQTLGVPTLRTLVGDVLMGANIRSATEALTRRRLSILNAALLTTYVSFDRAGLEPLDLPGLAREQYRRRGLNPTDRIILRWVLGFTGKQVENVLRSDDAAWDDYVHSLRESLSESSGHSQWAYGTPGLSLDGSEVTWEWAHSLMMAIGAQTLAIRGSEKSLYGKFFEKLVLGSVLSLLGFGLVDTETVSERSFWLSSRGNKRESDATAIWSLGQGVRFDIGFIGAGNPEITLDKVTRFEREIEMSGVNHYMHTFIIVDRVGRRSRIVELAEEVGGTIIQMSASDWGKTLGDCLADVLDGYASPLSSLGHSEYAAAVRRGVGEAPFESIFDIAMSPGAA